MIKSLHNKHAGEECAILLNGPTLSDYDLSLIDCTTIGVNRSWLLHDADYHVAGDDIHWTQRKPSRRGDGAYVSPLMGYPPGKLITGPDGPAHAIKVNDLTEKLPEVGPVQPKWRAPFGWSWDLEQGAYLCGSISLFVLQVAVYMGFAEIYLLGFDLCARDGQSKFKGHPDAWREYKAERWEPRQRELMAGVVGELQGKRFRVTGKGDFGYSIWNLSPITKCEELPRKTFEEVFIERKGRAGNRDRKPQQSAKAEAGRSHSKGNGDNGRKAKAKGRGQSQGRGRGRGRKGSQKR